MDQNVSSLCISVPEKKANFKPDVYHQYVTQSIDFFVPNEIVAMLEIEKKDQSTLKESEKECVQTWRGIYSCIPQPNKTGADGINPSNSSGIILTEDLLVGYFDQTNGQDILYIVLLWARTDESKEEGWVLPGKRDRAYDKNSGDISIEDANYSLVEKEIGVDRSEVAYHVVLGYFDDRKREQRMKSSGFVSFVLLRNKPRLIPCKRIGIPLNALIQLAKREITIPNTAESNERYGLIRNHDSLLLNVFETTKFYHTMDKIKLNQARWRELQRTNGNCVRPSFSELDSGFDCEICTELLLGAKIICMNGHTICGSCTETVYAMNQKCPTCRNLVLSEPVKNIALENIVQNQYPKLYAERYIEITGHQPTTWKDDVVFNGTQIQYRS